MGDPAGPPTLRRHERRLTTIDCVAQSLAVGPIFSAAALGAALAGLSGGVGPFVVLAILCVGAYAVVRSPLGIVCTSVGLATAAGGVPAQFIPGTAPTGNAVWDGPQGS